MPQVPRYDSRGGIEVSRASQNIQADPNAFGAAEARALQGVAGGIDAIARRAEEVRDENDERDAQEAFLAASDRLREATRGEKGFLTRQGRDAEDGHQDYVREIDAIATETAMGLGPRAQQRFRELYAARRESALSQGATHVYNERQSYRAQLTQAAQADASIAAMESRNDEVAFAEAIAQGSEAIRQRGQLTSTAPEAVAVEVAAFQSDTILASISAALDAGEERQASALLERFGDKMVAGQREQAQGLLNSATQAREEQADVEGILSRFGTDETAARRYIRENFEGEEEDRRITRYNRRAAELASEQNVSEAQLFSQVEELLSNGATVDTLPPTIYAALDSDMRDYYRRLETGEPRQSNFDYYDRVRTLSPAEIRLLDPQEMRRNLADREYSEMMSLRDEALDPVEVEALRSVNQNMRGVIEQYGFDEEEANQFFAITQTALDAERQQAERDGRRFTSADRERVVAEMALEARFRERGGLFGLAGGRTNRTARPGLADYNMAGVDPAHQAGLELAFVGETVDAEIALEAYQVAVAKMTRLGVPFTTRTIAEAVRREHNSLLAADQEAVERLINAPTDAPE